jgi:hypothetical protein
MIGRLAYENPWAFSDVDRRFFGAKNPGLSRKEILEVILFIFFVFGVFLFIFFFFVFFFFFFFF